MTEFVHLHNHTDYSLLDGAMKIDDMVAKAKSLGMTSIAITDHGNMFLLWAASSTWQKVRGR